ncbi:hypothetical protein [Frigidibacter sp.]|uniref:hypothetical protein n=1 Tax=Frigidibacter sp. TaxID=2586418 RepID=UPI0027348CE1|nr:hypothetical protein [Frigidibacter sp.]MDP3341618.1 hypothetical protein [Frigidibacter sp.]
MNGAVSAAKVKYSQSKLIALLEYLESDPAAASRQASLNEIAAIKKRKLPLNGPAERRFYIDVAIQKGFASSEYPAASFYEEEDDPRYGCSVGYLISLAGREYLDRKRSERLPNLWWQQLLNNVPTILVSVLTALLVGWALDFWGPSIP